MACTRRLRRRRQIRATSKLRRLRPARRGGEGDRHDEVGGVPLGGTQACAPPNCGRSCGTDVGLKAWRLRGERSESRGQITRPKSGRLCY